VSCSCPDRAVPCKHAAAVCYPMADVLDADPFALLLLRGRGRQPILAGLRQLRGRSGGTGARPRGEAGNGSRSTGGNAPHCHGLCTPHPRAGAPGPLD
jgi:uncharacterized Zn finger protein